MPNLTLLEWAKTIDPNGSAAVIAELLSQTNAILTDAVFIEGNLPTGHRVTLRVGLPAVYWRQLNQGVPTSKSKTAQVDEAIGMLEAFSEVDCDLVKLNGNEAAFRLSEARAFIEAMNQEQAATMFYGNPAVDPEKFLGLAPRYSDLAAGNSQNILDAGGTAAAKQTSIWLITWGDNTIFCPFPKGSEAGLVQEDHGVQIITTGADDSAESGKRMKAFVERFQWKNGLVVKDWRYAVRICNIGTAAGGGDITKLTGTMDPIVGFDGILHQMIAAIARIPALGMGRSAFYCNRTSFTGLMRSALEKSNRTMSIQNAVTQFGTNEAMLSFLGIPIRQCDAILNTEAVVT